MIIYLKILKLILKQEFINKYFNSKKIKNLEHQIYMIIKLF